MSLRIVVQKIHSLSLFLSPDSHHVIKKKKRKVAVSKDVHQKEKEWCTLRKKSWIEAGDIGFRAKKNGNLMSHVLVS